MCIINRWKIIADCGVRACACGGQITNVTPHITGINRHWHWSHLLIITYTKEARALLLTFEIPNIPEPSWKHSAKTSRRNGRNRWTTRWLRPNPIGWNRRRNTRRRPETNSVIRWRKTSARSTNNRYGYCRFLAVTYMVEKKNFIYFGESTTFSRKSKCTIRRLVRLSANNVYTPNGELNVFSSK